MSILSTNTRLIKVGQDYSAGSGISIDDHTISVTGEFGKTYSAGDNISIYEQGEQLYISSKDWEQDIANASANAYNEAVAQITATFDPSFISGQVDNKLDTTAFTAWQNGQYTTDLQTIEGQISNKLDETAFSQVSASFLTAINIPESAVWQDVSTTVQTNSAQWAEGGIGDEEVNALIHSNSGTWNTVTNKLDSSSFSTVSGNFLTSAPANMATTGDVAELAQTISETYQTKGDYLVRSDSANFYPSNNPSGFITGVDLSNFYTKDETSGKEELANAFANIPSGDEGVNSFVHNNSATINEVNTTYQANSGSYQPSGNYIPYTAIDPVFNSFVTNSGLDFKTVIAGSLKSTSLREDFITVSYINSNIGINNDSKLTTCDLIFRTSSDSAYIDKEKIHNWDSASNYIQNNSATWDEVSTTVQSNSAQWGQGGGAISSYTTAWSNEVPPYGGVVINTLDEKFISAFISNSAFNAKKAIESESAKSANYALGVNETYLENKGFTRNLSSEYGTISVIHNNIIESTNSAIVRTGNEGFVSSFEGQSIGPAGNGTATFIWDKALPNTTINLDMSWSNSQVLTYSANTDLTGEIVLPSGPNTQTINIPNATEFKVWANDWISINSATVSAADMLETTVGELAWASALPTYEYDSTNKISAINGSALAGGSEVPSGTMNVSGLEYNAVNEISAYNGSAIAQYGAEKQWLVHDDTLVHAANSAQYALGVNVSALQRLMGIDETVLFSGDGTQLTAFTVSEPLTNFNEVLFYVAPNNSLPAAKVSIPMVGYNTTKLSITYDSTWNGFKGGIKISTEYNTTGMSAFECTAGAWFGWAGTAANTGDYSNVSLYKIIGIGRKA